jgi:hypothetical protein
MTAYARERLIEERWYLQSKPCHLRAPDHEARLAEIEARLKASV